MKHEITENNSFTEIVIKGGFSEIFYCAKFMEIIIFMS